MENLRVSRCRSWNVPNLTDSNVFFTSIKDASYLITSVKDIYKVNIELDEPIHGEELNFKLSDDMNEQLDILSAKAYVNNEFIIVAHSGDIIKFERERANLIGQISDGIIACSWSPSGDIIALVTGKHQLILMTASEFDVIFEGPVETEEAGQEKFVNVGWGKKETQFHGSAGKQAAQKKEVVLMRPAPGDTGVPFISWRGDGELFAINQVDNSSSARRIRVFDKFGMLQSVSEPVAVLESSISWMPNGALIASTAIHPDGRRQVVFFERNGLRHGEFYLRRQNLVKNLSWNQSSDILTVLYDDGLVELWISKNYHWYLKLSFNDVEKVFWSSSRFILMQENSLKSCQIESEIFKSQCDEKDKLSLVAVLDGSDILITPFGIANVPPPMSFGKYTCEAVPDSFDIFSISDKTEFILAYSIKTTLTAVRGLISNHMLSFDIIGTVQEVSDIKQIVINHDYLLVQLTSGDVSVYSHALEHYSLVDCPIESSITKCGNFVQLFDGRLFNFASNEFTDFKHPKGFCTQLETFSSTKNEMTIVGLSHGQVYANDEEICNGVEFIYQIPEFIIFGMQAEKSIRFIPKSKSSSTWQSILKATDEESTRRIEAGSRLIVSSVSSSFIVLQAPRGNLESVYPRALVLSSVRRSIASLDYLKAYLECRRHRLDLNILFDVAPTTFLQTIDIFINQIKLVDYLNLFIAGLKAEDTALTKYPGFGLADGKDSIPDDKVNVVCNNVRDELLKREDSSKYVETIMTTYVCQKPPQLEAALQSIIELSTTENSETLEKSLGYLIFLVDATTLYDVALGLYHLPLALSIARRSQKDPKEYLLLLEDLSSIKSESLRNFRIDSHQGNHEKAVAWYWMCLEENAGGVSFEGFLQYVQQYGLYHVAINLVKDDRIRQVYLLYAHYRRSANDLTSAASLYRLAEDVASALETCVESGNWQQALNIARDLPADDFQNLIGDLYVKLIDQRRFLEAFNLALAHVSDEEMKADGALDAAIRGGLWLEALTIPSVDVALVISEALNAAETCMNEFSEIRKLFDEKSERLLLLQRQLLEPPQPTASNVNDISDSLSEMSFRSGAASTIITRTSAYSGTSTQRNRKKQERKKMRAKPGSPFERDGLRLILTEQIEKVKRAQASVQPLLIVLAENDQLPTASQLQSALDKLISDISTFSKTFRQLQEKFEFKAQHDILNLPREILNSSAINEETESRHAWHIAFNLSSEFTSGSWKLDYI